MTINTLSVPVYSINMAINPIRDGAPCKHNILNKLNSKLRDTIKADKSKRQNSNATLVCFTIIGFTFLLLLLLLLLQFIVLFQVDIGRLHSDDGFVQEAEGFFYMFGLHLWGTSQGKIMVH